MASVHSPIRDFLKPILFKLMGRKRYAAAQTTAKIRDIDQRLVEEDEMALLPLILKEDSVAIDVGANYMYYSIAMARLAPKGTIYAFEPIPFTYAVAKRIAQHYKTTNVMLYDKGVGERNERMTFEVPLQDFGAPSAGQAHMGGRNNEESKQVGSYKFNKVEQVTCDVVAIDSFLPELKKPDFVKIDIEGADLFALRGMRQTLAKFKPMVLIEIVPSFLHGFGLTEKQVYDEVTAMGYAFYQFDKGAGKLRQASLPFVEGNYILLPSSSVQPWQHLL
jgi:FkbM family methyltransferase